MALLTTLNHSKCTIFRQSENNFFVFISILKASLYTGQYQSNIRTFTKINQREIEALVKIL